MSTQNIIIILMALLFVAGGFVGHAIGYMRRREQLAITRQQLRIAYGRIRALEVDAHDVRRHA